MGRHVDLDDDELLTQTREDPDAFGAFYDRHFQSVLGYMRRQGLPMDEAVDLTAEVFAAALHASDRYRPGGPPATAWLFGIARNKLGRTRRRGAVERSARRKLGIEPVSFSDEALDRVEERLDAAQRIHVDELDRLPPAERSAVQARVLNGRAYGAIAADEGTTPAAIRQRVQRGLTKLAQQEGDGT